MYAREKKVDGFDQNARDKSFIHHKDSVHLEGFLFRSLIVTVK